MPPKIWKEVPHHSGEGKCEAGPGPSTLASRSRSLCEPAYDTCTDPRSAPRPPVACRSSDDVSLDCPEGGPENCADCLEQLRNDIVDVENLAREMRAEYEVARAKIEGTNDFVVVIGDVRAEDVGGGQGKERA